MADLTQIFSQGGVPFTVATPYAPRFKNLIDALEAGGYPLYANQSGGYNPRNIAGTSTPSQHAFGRAIDVNWNDNPRGGNQPAIPADLARNLASQYGFTWGGDWKNPDPMHFEINPNWQQPAQGGSAAAQNAPNASGVMALGRPQPDQKPMPQGQGILSAPQTPDESEYAQQLKGILGNLGNDQFSQALLALGAGIAGNSQRGWGAGIGAGLQGAQQALGQNTQNRMSLLEALANEHARQQQLALQANSLENNPQYRQAQIEKAQTEAAAGKLIPMDMGVDPVTFQPRKGLINPATKQGYYFNSDGTMVNVDLSGTKPVQPGAAPSASSLMPSATDKNGQPLGVDEYLKGIPDVGIRGKVGAVLRGEDSLPAIGTRSGQPYQQMVQRYVYNYDPTFNPTEAQNRVSIEKSLANQKSGLGAASASVGKMGAHFNKLADDAQALGTGAPVFWNKVTQAFETQSGDPRVTNFVNSLNIYGHEFQKVLKSGLGSGAAPTDQDMQQFAAGISQAHSPEQLRGALLRFNEAARNQIDSIDSTTQRSMGDKYYNPDKHSIITPYAKKQFEKADANKWLHPELAQPAAPQGSPQPQPPGANVAAAPPRPANVPPGSAYSPSRNAWRTPQGQIIPGAM